MGVTEMMQNQLEEKLGICVPMNEITVITAVGIAIAKEVIEERN